MVGDDGSRGESHGGGRGYDHVHGREKGGDGYSDDVDGGDHDCDRNDYHWNCYNVVRLVGDGCALMRNVVVVG